MSKEPRPLSEKATEQDEYPDLLSEEFISQRPASRTEGDKNPTPAPASTKASRKSSERVEKAGPKRKVGTKKKAASEQKDPQAISSRNSPPSLEKLLQPPHTSKLSITLDVELHQLIEQAVTNLHNSGDFTRYATFADVYRKAFALYFAGQLKPTEIYRKGNKKRTTLLVNEEVLQSLKPVNPRIRSRLLEQVLRTFYLRHFNE